ncbi:HET-domain-containing protein [Whalleya microplaca]|nr:HET-domain-containing protein [Whalleya microplaca]
MDSCSVCRNLIPLPGPSGGFITGGKGTDLENSSSSCTFCSILWEGLSAFCSESPSTAQWMALRQEDDAFRLEYKLLPDDERWTGLHFYAKDSRCPLSDVFKPSRDLEPYTGSAKYLGQVRDWVETCCKSHDVCKNRLEDHLPTRVLDVSRQKGHVLLYEPDKTDRGHYVALSHCWGGIVPIRTTMATLDTLKAGISIESLPKTFQDAIFITQQLQCRYIWIDSLCIIQDSTDDWKREASRMAEVYGNSYVTIAATASINSSSGLFYQHTPHSVKHIIEHCGQDGQLTTINVRPSLEHSSYFSNTSYGLKSSESAPLLERAWCFQEYLLAPRVLSFTRWEILWVCLSQRLCNCGTFSESTREVYSTSDLKARFDLELRSGSKTELHRLWKDIVEAYSRKGISFDTDKLPALAGITQLFADKDLGRYVNGLWEPTMVSDLFWELDRSFRDYYDVTTKRSTDQAMPSWSWASVHGPFRYSPSKQEFEGIEVIEVAYEHGKPNLLAEVSARAITVRGVLTEARAWGGCDEKQSRWIQVTGLSKHSWLIAVASELVCRPENPANVYILCGTKGPGLVLRHVQGTKATYRRLGIVEGYPPSIDGVFASVIQLT